MNEVITPDGEVLQGERAIEAVSMVTKLAKAEITTQVETARMYPRSVTKCIATGKTLATLNSETAAELNYALPRGNKTITGPSIRLAEIAFTTWGNCRAGARVVEVDRVEKFLEAEGVFHDLETNAATTARVRRKISTTNGKLFNDDMIVMAGNAACSIAKRNAILAGIPKGVWGAMYEAALEVIKGTAKTLSERRSKAFELLGAFGVTPAMIFLALEIEGEEEIKTDHMPILIGWYTGLKNEETTVEELFGGEDDKADDAKPKGKGGKKTTTQKLKEAVKDDKKPDDKKPAKSAKSSKKTDDGDGSNNSENPDDGADGEGGGGDDRGGEPEPETDGDQGGASEEAEQADGDAPTKDELEEASQLGEVAAARKRPRSSCPKRLKEVPALKEAWEAGFDGYSEE